MRGLLAQLRIALPIAAACLAGGASEAIAQDLPPVPPPPDPVLLALPEPPPLPLPGQPSPPPPASPTPGGVSPPGRPVAGRVVCKTLCSAKRKARTGSVVKIRGRFLDYAEYMVFRGASGPMPVSLTYRDALRVRAVVPPGAISSRPYVIAEGGVRSNRTKRKLGIRPTAPVGAGVFPVQGPHGFGGSDARFGAPRSGHTHQGQDVTAACGTPLVSVMAGTVQYAGYQSGAGNYVVIDNDGVSSDFTYFHMLAPAPVVKNQAVTAGQSIGAVGNTGNSFGCHLHFEYWEGEWYGGGAPIDPLPSLLAWDATS